MDKRKIVIIALALLVVTGISISAIALINRHDENNKVDMVSEELAISNDLDEEEPELKTDDYAADEKKAENKNEKRDDADNKKSDKDDSKSEDGLKENNSQKKESGNSAQDNKNDDGSNNAISDDKSSTSDSNNVTVSVVTEQQTTEAAKPTESASQQPVTTEAPKTTEASSGSGTTTEKEKVWHDPVYEDVWVVDTPAWDEDVVEYHDICNQCGFDFTTTHVSVSEHQQATISPENPTGTCWSYSTDVPVVVNTIHHDEKGHYEQKLVKDGYWE